MKTATASALALLLGAVACGDDGSADGTSSDATGSTTSPATSPGTDDAGTSGQADGSGDLPTDSSDTDEPPNPPPPSPVGCDPLPPPMGETVEIGPEDDLAATISAATEGQTILLRDGTYDLSASGYIVFDVPGVTLRSLSGDPSAVILDGGYAIGSILNVRASEITIAELTIQRCMWHPIHVTGGTAANTVGTTIYRVRTIDPGQQAIKINASGEGFYSDFGSVTCSHIELTDEGRSQIQDCYTGGIDAHLGWGWEIRDNYIEGFWCESGLSEHAVHFWNGARDTLVERNVIVDCARGVGFGLGEGGNGTTREYDDDPCPSVAGYVGHFGGIIRNNTVWAARPALFASGSGFDSGVALEQACEASVVHNTIVSLQAPFTNIEYRFPNTQATIANNLVTHAIIERDGGQAMLMGNIQDAGQEHFVDAAGGDLHLADGSTAVDAGVMLQPGLADEDIDGEPRDGSPDVGADER